MKIKKDVAYVYSCSTHIMPPVYQESWGAHTSINRQCICIQLYSGVLTFLEIGKNILCIYTSEGANPNVTT